uniref:Uncharacterized protein n=1 Tax=viral metagenome TaxID=1070528 RepID=A0A6C0B541_9ZZZZ
MKLKITITYKKGMSFKKIVMGRLKKYTKYRELEYDSKDAVAKKKINFKLIDSLPKLKL